jgi:hypothetical protein
MPIESGTEPDQNQGESMIQQLIERWEANRAALVDWATETRPDQRQAVQRIVELTTGEPYEDDWCPDPERITVIDHGDYQGTQLFVVAAKGYQPSRHWAVYYSYGSCSGCDAYQDAQELPDAERRVAYERLLLTIVQEMREI